MRNIICVTMGKVQRWKPHKLPKGLMSCSILLTGWSLSRFPHFLMLSRDLSVWRVFGQPSGLRGQPSGISKGHMLPDPGKVTAELQHPQGTELYKLQQCIPWFLELIVR